MRSLEISEDVHAAWYTLRRLFKDADADGSGALDRQELATIIVQFYKQGVCVCAY